MSCANIDVKPIVSTTWHLYRQGLLSPTSLIRRRVVGISAGPGGVEIFIQAPQTQERYARSAMRSLTALRDGTARPERSRHDAWRPGVPPQGRHHGITTSVTGVFKF